jgi:hypothetical protein
LGIDHHARGALARIRASRGESSSREHQDLATGFAARVSFQLSTRKSFVEISEYPLYAYDDSTALFGRSGQTFFAVDGRSVVSQDTSELRATHDGASACETNNKTWM